jgi:hypothetical protein
MAMRDDRLLVTGCCGGQGDSPLRLESAQIHLAGIGVAPAEVSRGDDERRLIAEHLPEVVQLPAQVGQRLRVGRLRPEQPRDALPGLRRPGVADQERDQGGGPGRRCPGRRPAVGDGLLPQEGQVQHVGAASRRRLMSPAAAW